MLQPNLTTHHHRHPTLDHDFCSEFRGMQLNDVQIGVQVDDVGLEELDVRPQTDSASCYIASEAGKVGSTALCSNTSNIIVFQLFQVVATNKSKHHICFSVYLDGEHGQSVLVRPKRRSVIKGVQVDAETAKAFSFGLLKLSGAFSSPRTIRMR